MGRNPSHSNRPSPGTGSRPLQLRRRGWIPAACQPIVPVRSAHTMFSAGMRLYAQASRNSSHERAWFMRRLARYGADPGSSHAARTA